MKMNEIGNGGERERGICNVKIGDERGAEMDLED